MAALKYIVHGVSKPVLLCTAGLVLLLTAPVSWAQGDTRTSIAVPPGFGSMQEECTDVAGQRVKPGVNYVPGPDHCSVCKCEDGKPRFCRAVLCQPRQDCKSFRVGATCCDFICLDDVLPSLPDGEGNGEYPLGENSLGVRLAAAILTALMAFVLLLFLVHRLRQRRLAAQQYVNAQDAACCHSATYWHSSDQAQLFLHGPPCPPWKPPSCSMDAPPPYTEADAQRAQLVASSTADAAASSCGAGRVTGGRGGIPPPSAPPPYCSPPGGVAGGVSGVCTGSLGVSYNSAAAATHHRRSGSHGAEAVSMRFMAADHDREAGMAGAVGCSLAAGHSRDFGGGSGGALPASLGPLAVKLLPTGPDTTDLREQIQRQRQNLLDHNTRTLPRPGALSSSISYGRDSSGVSSSSMSVQDHSQPRLAVVNTLPRVTSPTVGSATGEGDTLDSREPRAAESTQTGNTKVSERLTQPRDSTETTKSAGDDFPDRVEGASCSTNDVHEDGAMNSESSDSNQKSLVRQSVLKFEAVAALEAADALSQRSGSPAVGGTAESPHLPDSSSQRRGAEALPLSAEQSSRNGLHCQEQQHCAQAQHQQHTNSPQYSMMQAPPQYSTYGPQHNSHVMLQHRQQHQKQQDHKTPVHHQDPQHQFSISQLQQHEQGERQSILHSGSAVYHPTQLPLMHLNQEHFLPQRSTAPAMQQHQQHHHSSNNQKQLQQHHHQLQAASPDHHDFSADRQEQKNPRRRRRNSPQLDRSEPVQQRAQPESFLHSSSCSGAVCRTTAAATNSSGRHNCPPRSEDHHYYVPDQSCPSEVTYCPPNSKHRDSGSDASLYYATPHDRNSGGPSCYVSPSSQNSDRNTGSTSKQFYFDHSHERDSGDTHYYATPNDQRHSNNASSSSSSFYGNSSDRDSTEVSYYATVTPDLASSTCNIDAGGALGSAGSSGRAVGSAGSAGTSDRLMLASCNNGAATESAYEDADDLFPQRTDLNNSAKLD